MANKNQNLTLWLARTNGDKKGLHQSFAILWQLHKSRTLIHRTLRLATSCINPACLKNALKENEDKIHAMKTAETVLLATADESKARIADLERQTRDLHQKLEGTEAERGNLGLRLDQALKELQKSREENAHRSTKEQVRGCTKAS